MADAQSSPTPPAQPPAATARMDALIAAAEHVFLSKGYHDATMSDIARQARMSKKTVYALIASKAELFGALLAHRQTLLNFPEPEPGWSLHDILCANLLALAKFLFNPVQVAITRLVIMEYAHSPDFSRAFIRNKMRKAKTRLQNCLLNLAIERGASEAEAKELASMLFGMALGEFHFGTLSGFAAPPSKAALEGRIQRAVSVFLAGCCPEGCAVSPPSPTCAEAPPSGQ